LIEKLRERYDVKPTYETYKLKSELWNIFLDSNKYSNDIKNICNSIDIQSSLSKNIVNRGAKKIINLSNKIITNEKEYGIYDGDYFTIIKIRHLYFDRYDEMLFLFTSDIERFCNEYIKPHEDLCTKSIIGTWNIKISCGGYHLVPVNIDVGDEPLLSNGYNNLLNNEVSYFLNNKKIYESLNSPYKRGILLYGPPGNGKTAYIKNYIHSLKDSCIILLNSVDYSVMDALKDFLNNPEYDDTFKLIIIEDIDGITKDSRSILLNLLDGVSRVNNTLFVSTTNHINKIDDSIVNRPSRFDRIIKIDVPDKSVRLELLKKYFPNEPYENIEIGADMSEGFSGAYFKELYLTTQIEKIDMLKSIESFSKRFKQFETEKSKNNQTEYLG